MVRAVVLQIVCFLWQLVRLLPRPLPRPTVHWLRLENDVLVGAWVSPGFGSFPALDW